MEKIFMHFDLFSKTPTLKINGKIRPSTLFGSCIGFLSLTFLLSTIIYVAYAYFSKLWLKIDSFVEIEHFGEINSKELKIGMLMTDFLGREFPDKDRIFSIQAKFWKIHVPLPWELNNVTRRASTEVENIDIIKCDEYKVDHFYKKEMSDYAKAYKNLVCLDLDTLNKNLTGVYGSFGK